MSLRGGIREPIQKAHFFVGIIMLQTHIQHIDIHNTYIDIMYILGNQSNRHIHIIYITSENRNGSPIDIFEGGIFSCIYTLTLAEGEIAFACRALITFPETAHPLIMIGGKLKWRIITHTINHHHRTQPRHKTILVSFG